MADVQSTMLELGTRAPHFLLTDTVSGKTLSLDDFKANKALLVMFICNHCPFVKGIKQGLVQYALDYMPKGVGIAAINSNDSEKYPDDGPGKMKQDAETHGYPFPYLYDETQEVARAYRAACTPDFYLFDGNRELVYRGQFDSSRPGNSLAVTGEDLREATDRIRAGRPVPVNQAPSIGCNIKWKKGNEPDYFG
ncbi:MAG: thioredoxin family protein [Balneolales bacterium]